MEHKISDKKYFSMVFLELFGMASLTLPAIAVRLAGENGLPALLLASAGLFLAAAYFIRVSEQKGISYRERLLGLPSGIRGIVTGTYLLRFLIHGWFLISLFLSLIQEVLLPDQKRFWILLPFLFLLLMTAGKTMAVRGNILEILFPWIFLPFLAVLILSFPRLHFDTLPGQLFVKGEGPDLTAAYGLFCFYQPVEFLLFLSPAGSRNKRGKWSPTVLACLLAAGIKILFFITAIGMFGAVRTGEKLWSSLYVMQSVRLPGNFVERLDILFLVFWIFGIFVLCSGYLFYSECILREPMKKIYPYVFVGLLILAAFGEGDPDQVFSVFLSYKMWIDVPVSILLPLLLWIPSMASGRKKSGKLALLLAVFLIPAALSGCQKKTDIEDRSYVMALGIEKGEKEALRVGYETADISKSTASGGGVQKGTLVTVEAGSLEGAEKKEQDFDDKKIDYGHLKALIISKDCVKEENIWKEMVEELEEKREFSGTTLVFFTEEPMEDYMNYFKEGETALGEYLSRMAANHKQEKDWEYTLADLLREEAEEKTERWVPVLTLENEGIGLKKKEWDEIAGASHVSDVVLRFHIRAESDSEGDQIFKNRIKDRILPYLQELSASCTSKEECIKTVSEHLTSIENQVEEACLAEGNVCESRAYLCREPFPMKIYGDMAFPEGIYDALRIDLGKAQGANWWCMIYPSLCLVDGVIEGVDPESEAYLADALEEEEYENLLFKEEKGKYHVKWKFLEKIREFFGEK